MCACELTLTSSSNYAQVLAVVDASITAVEVFRQGPGQF